MSKTAPLFLIALLLTVPAMAAEPAQVSEQASALHREAIVLDTHLDTPALFARPGWKILDRHSVANDFNQVDYPRMVEGGLDGGFWVIYTAQGPRTSEANLAARNAGLKRLVEIREMVAANIDHFEIALTAADAERIRNAGKRIVYISMENASPLASDPSLLSVYHDLGLRMLGIVHSSNNDFADSSTNPTGAEWKGLSPKGRALVEAANRMGILIDLSHASNDTVDQVLELSTAPVVLSHTSSFAITPHPRNLDDARIRKVAAKGGVIQVNSVAPFVHEMPNDPERRAAIGKIIEQFDAGDTLSPEQRVEIKRQIREFEEKNPLPQATFEDYMKHMLHILNVAGPEHVGLGADWDGGGGVLGMEDITALPKITERLLQEGYTPEQVKGVLGGNLLRLIDAAQGLANRGSEQ
ncbi:dipeptidase [Dokdonella sp.]|uniref:dipeptidase n=1 Tax=Dokdonella sp. TaxID=2291710 RepID=UPI003529C73B